MFAFKVAKAWPFAKYSVVGIDKVAVGEMLSLYGFDSPRLCNTSNEDPVSHSSAVRYLLPLRLAFNKTLLPASVVSTKEKQVEAIIEYIRPKFELILESK